MKKTTKNKIVKIKEGMIKLDKDYNSYYIVPKFTKVESLFYYLFIKKIVDRGLEPVFITREEVNETFNLSKGYRSKDNFIKLCRSVNKKMIERNIIELETETQWITFPLFNKILVEKDGSGVTIQAHELFEKWFNEVKSYYTINIEELNIISGIHAQNLYRLFNGFKDRGIYIKGKEAFNKLMGIENYRDRDIIKKVIEPAIKELEEKGLFKNVKFRELKNGVYKFTFEKIDLVKKLREENVNKIDLSRKMISKSPTELRREEAIKFDKTMRENMDTDAYKQYARAKTKHHQKKLAGEV